MAEYLLNKMKSKYLAMAVPVLLGAGLFNMIKMDDVTLLAEESNPRIRVLDINNVDFSEEAREKLYDKYSTAKTEIPFCLYGSVDGKKAFVDGVKLPHIIKSSKEKVRFDKSNCDMKRYRGIAHNHFEGCLPSLTDIRRITFDRKAKIELIVCGIGKEKGQMDMAAYYIDRNKR